ncbi:MAG: hypothetical protein IT374_01255 [Polyangiaceae bacterium]|nr:hypothetical protein [Polyangiaceae bacterium]
MPDREKPVRGLQAIHEARELREARKGIPTASNAFWVWSFIGVAVISIFYWRHAQGENDRTRARILAKQRTLAEEAGPRFAELRDKVERFAQLLSKPGPLEEYVDPAAAIGDKGDPTIFKRPGLYLRVAQPNAQTSDKLRAAARESARDAFTACLLHTPHVSDRAGPACHKSKECPRGQICNEIGVCATPSSPYNLRVAYRGMFPLEESWVRDVQTSSEELRLRLRETEIDSLIANDWPVAVGALDAAEYLLLLVDEVPSGWKPKEGDSLEESLSAEVHPVRVGLMELKSGRTLFKLRREVDVHVPVVPGNVEAQRRQILNCALAKDVRESLTVAR